MKSVDNEVELILSDMHHRISGVSATVRALVPKTTQMFKTALIFRNPISGYQSIKLLSLFRLLKAPIHSRPFRIWHVRRNNEMLWAIIARDFFHLKVKIVFTSAAIRRHSWYPRQLIKRMDAIIACSNKSASFVQPVYAVVAHGVDVSRFEKKTNALNVNLNWPSEGVVVGIVGRVRPEKGTDLFVHALLTQMSVHSNVTAVIVGKCTSKYQSFKAKLLQEIESAGKSNRFLWLDEIDYDDMPSIYQGLDVICSPALYEGFGVVPIEAMVSGTAIVASRTGAYEDMVQVGQNGFLVDCGNQDQLSESLSKLLSDHNLIEKFKDAGRVIVRSRFSIESEFAGISNVYELIWNESK